MLNAPLISALIILPEDVLNVKDIPSNRSLFQLAVSERHINGIGYGSLLPTVQTQGLKVCDKDGKTRFMDLSSLPKQGIKYGDLLPIPVASDHTGSCTIRKMTKSNGAPRTDSLRNMPAVIGMDGDRLNGRVFQLSPLFVEEMMGFIINNSRAIRRRLFPDLEDFEHIGYDGGSRDKINRKRLIGNTYQIYRSILHQLAIDENWNNVYSDITLSSGDMGTIKVERIDDEKKDEDV